MVSKNNKERYPYSVVPYKTEWVDDTLYLVCIMPNAKEAMELAVKLFDLPEQELKVEGMHYGYVAEYMLKQRTTYGYCEQLQATKETRCMVDLVFNYPWVAYHPKTRKDFIKEILKDLATAA